MKGYIRSKRELEENTVLKHQAQALLKLFRASLKTEFEICKLDFDYSLLKERGELMDWNSEKLKLKGGDAFFCVWFEELITDFGFELTADYVKVQDFIEQVENGFREKKLLGGLYSLVDRLDQWLMVTLNRDFNVDFAQHALSIKRSQDRDIFKFADNFSEALPYLKFSADSLITILQHLKKEMTTEGQVDGAAGCLRVGLKRLAKAQTVFAKELLNDFKSFENSHEYQALVLAGLIEAKGPDYLEQIKYHYLKTNYESILAEALAFQRQANDDLALTILNTTDNLNRNSPDILKFIPAIYSDIIDRNQVTVFEIKKRAFDSLISLWAVSKEVKPNILHQLNFLKSFEDERRAFIVEAFKDTDTNVGWIRNMFSLSKIATPDFFYQLVEVIAERQQMSFDSGIIEQIVSELVAKDDGKFSEMIIRLLIHDKGFVRFAASRIYFHLTFGRKKFRFKYDVLSLEETEQIKLIIATLKEMNQPPDTLPNLLKLLDSPYSKVVSLFILKLKGQVESFFDSVLKVMESGFEKGEFKNERAIAEVKAHHDEFVRYIERKESVNELNPWKNNFTLLKYYNELEGRKNRRLMEESVNEKSMIPMIATTIKLAKNGGWKIEGRDDIQQLGHFGSSSLFPRVYFIAPERFDYQINRDYIYGWEQIFKWEQIQ